MNIDKDTIEREFKQLQDQICKSMESCDGKSRFEEELWQREEGGGGRTRIIRNGNIIEKGGVNFSAVYGKTPEKILKALNLPDADFYATGVSIVMHPQSPMVPIIHMNIRYFEMSNGIHWFGGGIDLTPHYIDKSLAKEFHLGLKSVCDSHDAGYYPEFKKTADDYFYIKHRQETRGIGGIFFDRLFHAEESKKQQIFDFVLDLGKAFVPLYTSQIDKTRNIPYKENDKKWQFLRRSRYVEFNLVYDKGTKFGLDTNGRIESILMSMPPQANWEYNYVPAKGSKEEETSALLKKGIDWVNA